MEKQELFATIEPLFYEKTYKEVSLQEIADLLAIKKASLYYYFSSKEVLFLELLDFSFQKYLHFLGQIIAEWNENNFQDLLEKFLGFGNREKNIFSRITSSGYCEEEKIFEAVQEKQKIIFEIVHQAFAEKK